MHDALTMQNQIAVQGCILKEMLLWTCHKPVSIAHSCMLSTLLLMSWPLITALGFVRGSAHDQCPLRSSITHRDATCMHAEHAGHTLYFEVLHLLRVPILRCEHSYEHYSLQG